MKGGIPETPSVPFQLKFVNDIEAEHNTQQVASKYINDDMVPPTFLEIVKHISKTVLDELESNRFEDDDLGVTYNESFDEPSSRVCEGEEIKKCKPDVSEGIIFFFGIYSTIGSIRHFFVVVVLEIAVEVGVDGGNCGLFALHYTTFTKYAKYMRTAK